MKFRLDQDQTMYARPDIMAVTTTQIAVGEEVEIGSEVTQNGVSFVPMRRGNGQSGYLPGDTRGSHIKPMTINQKEAFVYGEPVLGATPRTVLRRGGHIWIFPGVVKQGAAEFVRVRDGQGIEGYIAAETKVKAVVEATRKIALRNMAVGGLFCVGGAAVTYLTYTSASEQGGTYFIMWGPVIFGAVQFFKGVGQFFGSAI